MSNPIPVRQKVYELKNFDEIHKFKYPRNEITEDNSNYDHLQSVLGNSAALFDF